jgi:hypothetical protein
MDHKPSLMRTELSPPALTFFPTTIAIAVSKLKSRLQEDYEEAYPGLSEIIRLILDEEEARAWELTPFPHLVLPGLVEVHVATLGLEPAVPRHHNNIFAPDRSEEFILAAAG